MKIIPAILTGDVQELDFLLRKIRDSSKFERAQIDFVDGVFANSLTIKPTEVDMVSYLPLKFDAHLMVKGDNVLFWGKNAVQMGFERVIMQVESGESDDYKCLGIDLDTQVELVQKRLKNLELVLLMSVKAGFGDQKFDEGVIGKIRQIGQIREIERYDFKICVDGGIEPEHLPILEKLGVDEVAVGAKRVLEW
ncbi:MAG: ribulose-phosphate 3-epimerase [Candidatus Amesbacteria bacterium GW2011_GWA2_42_12]|uniref:Ribulose-phosphate 3-epimerase n=1 Tax=Candidatus Amesbacteria bacterium GW2011_GWA2_42_12 TaxID=1618356 RepID=A0A0G1B5A4_9BACT|nr:MAG: ribulose-phosphate 3-epimerase [Candidatus Amesbacteria bacterium GW2011_GWA2_42_12]